MSSIEYKNIVFFLILLTFFFILCTACWYQNSWSYLFAAGPINSSELMMQSSNRPSSSLSETREKVVLNISAAFTTIDKRARFRHFIQNHQNIVENLSPKKFVYVVDNRAGYGNKLNALVSAFIVAIATHSAFIVSWPDIHKYIEEPFEKCFFSNFSAQNELNYKYFKNETFSFPYMTHNSFKVKKDFSLLYQHIVPSKRTRYVFGSIGPLYYELACNETYFQTYLDYGLVSKKTIAKASKVLKQKELETNAYNLNALYRIGTYSFFPN